MLPHYWASQTNTKNYTVAQRSDADTANNEFVCRAEIAQYQTFSLPAAHALRFIVVLMFPHTGSFICCIDLDCRFAEHQRLRFSLLVNASPTISLTTGEERINVRSSHDCRISKQLPKVLGNYLIQPPRSCCHLRWVLQQRIRWLGNLSSFIFLSHDNARSP